MPSINLAGIRIYHSIVIHNSEHAAPNEREALLSDHFKVCECVTMNQGYSVC